ncbi:MAG TPA: hypothetical protein VHC92_15720 [Rhodanobacteraceae bacterium]|nr:hypothetical protein [Rhodanobacteraceae bacterium]
MRTIALLSSVAAMLFCAVAQSAPPKLPPELRKDADQLIRDCTKDGGKATLADDYATAVDLNGDGVDDFVVDLGGYRCQRPGFGPSNEYCGSAGCPVSVWLSQPGGSYALAPDIGGSMQGWEIRQHDGKPAIWYGLHGAFCDDGKDRAGSDTCEKYWTAPPAKSASGARAPAEARRGAKPGASANPASGWQLRPIAGRAGMAAVRGPGVVAGLTLLCDRGSAFLTIMVKAPPPPGPVTIGFAASGEHVELPLRQGNPAGTLWLADVARSRLPKFLASHEGSAQLRINGGLQGDVPLANAGAVLRDALSGCYRF